MIFLNIRGSFLFLCIVLSTHVFLAQMDEVIIFQINFVQFSEQQHLEFVVVFVRGPKKNLPNIFILPVNDYRAMHFHRYLVIVS